MASLKAEKPVDKSSSSQPAGQVKKESATKPRSTLKAQASKPAPKKQPKKKVCIYIYIYINLLSSLDV